MTARLPDPGTVRGEVSREILLHRDLLVPPVLETGALRPAHAWWADFREQLCFDRKDWVGTDMQAGPTVDLVFELGKLEGSLPRDAYNSVLCAETLEHVAEPFLALLDLKSAMRPGAWILITMPFGFPIHDFPDDYWRFTPSGLRMMLEDAGFVDVETHGFNWFPVRLQDHLLDEPFVKREMPMHVFGKGRVP
jgi:hypothetical protein